MNIYTSGRRRTRRLIRTLAAVLLTVLLTSSPGAASIAIPTEKPAAYTVEER